MKKTLSKLIILILAFVVVASSAIASLAFSKGDGECIDASQFEGKTIGVQTGTIYAELIGKLIDDVELKYYDTNTDMIAALIAGKVDAAANDEPVMKYAQSNNEGLEVARLEGGEDYLAFIAAKTDDGQALVDDINAYLDEITASGEMDEIYTMWFDTPEDEKTMEDYSKYPATNGTLVIGSDPTFAPFEYVKDNQVVGFDIDIVVRYCKARGYKPKFVDAVFGGIIAGVDTGKFDLGVSGFSITEERKKEVLFTNPVYVSYPAIMYRSEEGAAGFFDDISGSFRKTFIEQSRWKAFVEGIVVTLAITVLSIIFGTLLGFFSYSACRKGNKIANAISKFVSWLIRGLPEVVLLMILFYIVFGNSSLSGVVIAIIAFTLTFACSMHAMLDSGERALDPGQARAATALGYSDVKAFFRIILPQSARHFMPAYLEEVSMHIKATAVVGYIAVVDITKVADIVRGATYDAFFPLIAIAVLYFILAGILKQLVKLCTRRLDVERRSKEEILKGVELR